MKKEYTEKERRILKHVQTMGVLVTALEIEYMNDLVDHKFKQANLNNHIRRIKESIQQIRSGLSFKYRVMDRDLMENEHGATVHRLFAYFSTMDTKQLTEIVDAYEAYDKDNPPEIVDLMDT